MLDTLNLGKYINYVVTNDASINVEKAYPLVADNDAKYPFVVYRRTNLISANSKDGLYQDTVTL